MLKSHVLFRYTNLTLTSYTHMGLLEVLKDVWSIFKRLHSIRKVYIKRTGFYIFSSVQTFEAFKTSEIKRE